MKSIPAFSALLGAAACALVAAGCVNDSRGGKGGASVSIQLEKVGALRKAGASAEIRMKILVLTLRSPGEKTFNDTLTLSGNAAQSLLKEYEGLTSKKTWTLEAIARDTLGINIYRDSVKFTVPPEGKTEVNLVLKAAYSMLRASFYPIRDSVTRCELWVSGNLAADSTFPQQALVGDTVTISADYVPAKPNGTPHTVVMKVYGNWFGVVNALMYTGEGVITVYSGQDASYDIALTRVAPPAPIGQAKMNVSFGAIGTLGIKARLEDKSWFYVGDSTGLSPGMANHVAMGRDSAGRMNVAYSDQENGGKATLLRWDGTTWSTVGAPGFTPGAATNLSLALSSTSAHVSFRDSANGNKASVMRWDGASWIPVGALGLSQGEARHVSMALTPGGAPVVAYQDAANGERLSVVRWNGAAWEYLGTPGGASAAQATAVSLGVSAAGTIYVAFRDEGAGGSLTLATWNGSTWEYVGARGFYAGNIYLPSLAISSTGVPYVAFLGSKEDYLISVVRWEDGAWKHVGTPGFSPSTGADNVTLALSKDDKPYLAYRLKLADGGARAEVLAWTGSLWQSTRGTRISKGYADSYALAFSANGSPFVAFRDYPLGARLIVMTYAEPCCTGYLGASLTKAAAGR